MTVGVTDKLTPTGLSTTHIHTRTHNRTAGGSEQEMKIWDIRKLSCVQDIIDTTLHKPQNKMTCIALDSQRGSLVRPPLCAPRRAVRPG